MLSGDAQHADHPFIINVTFPPRLHLVNLTVVVLVGDNSVTGTIANISPV